MNRALKLPAGALAFLVMTATPALPLAAAGTILHEDFAGPSADRWTPVRFGDGPGKGQSRVVSGADGRGRLEIATAGAFLGMVRRKTFEASEYPELSFRWLVSVLPTGANIERREGDDAAAKVYVVFERSTLLHPFGTAALVYVWAAHHRVGTMLPNPYAPRQEKVLVLQSGADRLNQWITERVDLVHDYRRAFGEDPGAVKAIMLASDSDDTRSESRAEFGEIAVSRRDAHRAVR